MKRKKKRNKTSRRWTLKRMNKSDLTLLFLHEVMIMEDMIQFMGVMKILGVKFSDDEGVIRPTEDLLSDAVDKFIKLKNKKQIDLVQIIQFSNAEAAKDKEKISGTESRD